MATSNMVHTCESLNKRFPILDVVIKYLSCADAEKTLLKELFVTVYGVGYDDGRAAINPFEGLAKSLNRSIVSSNHLNHRPNIRRSVR